MDFYFEKNKSFWFFIIISITSLVSIFTGPLYEAYVDISVSPPEHARQTDFSWITVNEWFNTQTYLISSHDILKYVTSDIREEELKKTIAARRIDTADIIRITARSKRGPFVLQEIVGKVSEAYLKSLGKTEEKKPANKKENSKPAEKENRAIDQSEYQGNLNLLYSNREKIKKEIEMLSERLKRGEMASNSIGTVPEKYKEIENRIDRLNEDLLPLKQKLAQLRTVYAEGWPEVSELREKVKLLEQEREKYRQELDVEFSRAKEAGSRKNKIDMDIRSDKEKIGNLKKELGIIDSHINGTARFIEARDEERTVPQEEDEGLFWNETRGEAGGAVINPPIINFFPELWIRLIFGIFIGFLVWSALSLLLQEKVIISKRLVSTHIGELLKKEQKLTDAQLKNALEIQKQQGGLIGEILISLGYAREEEVAHALTVQYGFQYYLLEDYEIDPEIIKIIPLHMAQKYKAIPLEKTAKILTVVMVNPLNLAALKEITVFTKCIIQPAVTTHTSFQNAFREYYKPD